MSKMALTGYSCRMKRADGRGLFDGRTKHERGDIT